MSTPTRLSSSYSRSSRKLFPSLMIVSIWRVWRVARGIGIEDQVSPKSKKPEWRSLKRLCKERYPRFMYRGQASMIRLFRWFICCLIRSVAVRMIDHYKNINCWISSRKFLREKSANSRPPTNKSVTKWPASSQPSNSPLRRKLYWWKTTTKN